MKKILIAALIVAGATVSAFAQLSMAKADWIRGPVQFLLTPEEKTQWNAIKSDAEADRFIALFWARRDPTPGTPQNEFREEVERRVQYADQKFAAGRQRGSLTDRGKVLILFGPPSVVRRSGGQGRGTITAPGTAPSGNTLPGTSPSEAVDTENSERQVWVYDGERAAKLFNAPKVELRFLDRLNSGDFRMETPTIDFNAAAQRIAAAAITQPGLKEPPTYAQQPAQQPVATAQPAPDVPMTTLKTAALETALAAAKTNKEAAKGSTVSYAEFVSPMGDYFVPLGINVPAAAGVTADSADTYFGVIEDATGKRVLAWEEPAKLTADKSDLFAAHSVSLPSGKYTATVGLAKAGVPVVITSGPLELSSVAKDSVGVSKLILANMYQTTDAAPIKAPYAFGQLKIVPRSTFSNKDALSYFVELHNPAIDPATNQPKVQIKLDLLDASGTPVAGAPLSEMPAAALSGQPGPGEYALIGMEAIPLSQMAKPLAAGNYTLRMKIVDTVSKKTYTVEQKLKITA